MLRYLVDESVHGDITRALLRRRSDLDLVRAQDVGLAGVPDPAVLAAAATDGRIVLTSDVATLVGYAYDRLLVGAAMPGVFVLPQEAALGALIEDLLLLAEASDAAEWDLRVVYLPL